MRKEMRLFFVTIALFFVMGSVIAFASNNAHAADSCSGAGETCRKTDPDPTSSTGYRNPAGYDCTFRGTCSGEGTACCKPIGSAANTNTNTNTLQSGSSGTSFSNPLKFATVDQFLSQIMGALQKIIVTLSLLVIVYGSVLYVISAGGKQVDEAKKAITAALVGLALGLAAPSFLKEIAGILGWGTTDTRLAAALSLSQIAINVLNFLLGSLGILSLIMLVIGAGMYLSSAGDQGQIDTGKKIFKSALIGVFLAMASMVLVTQVARLFTTSSAPSSTPSSSSSVRQPSTVVGDVDMTGL